MTHEGATSDVERPWVWSPGLDLFHAPVRPRSGLKIACLVQSLLEGLRHEAHLQHVTPHTDEEAFRQGQPDFLLVESCWSNHAGEWAMAQSSAGGLQEQLVRLIRLAKGLGLPTVYWMTLDSSHVASFQAFMGHFDQVFCADHRAIDLLQRQGIRAALLLPAIQPRVCNPIRRLRDNADFQPGIVYNGLRDLFKFPEIQHLLRKMPADQLSVMETACLQPPGGMPAVEELAPALKGWLPGHLVPEILKRAQACITLSQTETTPTRAVWQAMEVMACRTPLVHLGPLPEEDPRTRWGRTWSDPEAFVQDVTTLTLRPLEREKVAHLAWREMHSHHTLAHRLDTLCLAIGVDHAWPRHPRATLVTGTMRPQLLEKCLRQYLAQTWPNKELVLVYNGPCQDVAPLQAAHAGRSDIHIAAIPTDFHAATLLNYGIRNATGDYFFRVDDDDHYGDHYIEDCMLYLYAMDADIFGKRASFFHFEGDESLYLRKNILPAIQAFEARILHKSNATLISGCSFASKMALLTEIPYPDHVNLSADTELVAAIKEARPDAACLIVDNLNLVVERFADVSRHTWRDSPDTIKDKSTIISSDMSDIMV